MREGKLAYFAGFFDGEGCIVIGNTKHILQCSITSTTKWVLELFRFNFNGSVSKKQIYQTQKGQHTMYRWYVTGPTARVFLETILPYLNIKRPEAEVAIKFQLRKEKMHYVTKRHPVPKSERVLREAERILLQKLKEQAKGNTDSLETTLLVGEEKNDQLPLL